jgi:hypothetical protein
MTDLSSRPVSSPHQTPTRTERRIIKVRLARGWEPARIASLLGLTASTVHRVLTRYGVTRLSHRQSHRPADTPLRTRRSRGLGACKSAEQVGPACVEVIAALAEGGVLFKLRQAQGILGLRDRHTPDRLEAACRKDMGASDPSYRTIKGILALGAETNPVTRPTGDGGAAAFLHGPSLLFGDALTTANLHSNG